MSFPNIEKYVSLDLGPNSEAAKALNAKLADEAASPRLSLSADSDDTCPAVTSAMRAWLNAHVSPVRRNAIAEIEAAARRIKIGKKTDGILAEKELSAAEQSRHERRGKIYSGYHDKNGALLDEIEFAEDEYDRMRIKEGARDAKVPNPVLEWGILFPLILIPEALLNFESFRRAPIVGSDAMALGITILVGVAIAVAAHLIGSYAKQFNFYSRPDDEGIQGDGFRKWSIGSALLTAALAAVASARYYYLIPLAAQAEMIGQDPPNIAVQIGGSLIGNVVVFLIGAAFTFLLHDTNPLFTEKRVVLDKKKKLAAALRKNEVDDQLKQVDLRYKQRTDEIAVLAQQMNGLDGYNELREAFSRIQAKDSEVVSLLESYKGSLVSRLEARGDDFRFKKNVIGLDRNGDSIDIALSDFAASGVRLCY
ncbi:MAG: hypothetical protein HLUCCX21_03320 [Porphyrobacter sp. HL-46]|nr:MAG: hypothetical protein HLUCCX21_03320 [Porphyrobacter sp. HL-46]